MFQFSCGFQDGAGFNDTEEDFKKNFVSSAAVVAVALDLIVAVYLMNRLTGLTRSLSFPTWTRQLDLYFHVS